MLNYSLREVSSYRERSQRDAPELPFAQTLVLPPLTGGPESGVESRIEDETAQTESESSESPPEEEQKKRSLLVRVTGKIVGFFFRRRGSEKMAGKNTIERDAAPSATDDVSQRAISAAAAPKGEESPSSTQVPNGSSRPEFGRPESGPQVVPKTKPHPLITGKTPRPIVTAALFAPLAPALLKAFGPSSQSPPNLESVEERTSVVGERLREQFRAKTAQVRALSEVGPGGVNTFVGMRTPLFGGVSINSGGFSAADKGAPDYYSAIEWKKGNAFTSSGGQEVRVNVGGYRSQSEGGPVRPVGEVSFLNRSFWGDTRLSLFAALSLLPNFLSKKSPTGQASDFRSELQGEYGFQILKKPNARIQFEVGGAGVSQSYGVTPKQFVPNPSSTTMHEGWATAGYTPLWYISSGRSAEKPSSHFLATVTGGIRYRSPSSMDGEPSAREVVYTGGVEVDGAVGPLSLVVSGSVMPLLKKYVEALRKFGDESGLSAIFRYTPVRRGWEVFARYQWGRGAMSGMGDGGPGQTPFRTIPEGRAPRVTFGWSKKW